MTEQEKLEARILNLEQALGLIAGSIAVEHPDSTAVRVAAHLFEANTSLGSPVWTHSKFVELEMGEEECH